MATKAKTKAAPKATPRENDGDWEVIKPRDKAPTKKWNADNTDEPLEGIMGEPARVRTRYGERDIYTITTDDGEIVAVWKSAGLSALDLIRPGARVRITPTGWEKDGSKEKRTFQVQRARG